MVEKEEALKEQREKKTRVLRRMPLVRKRRGSLATQHIESMLLTPTLAANVKPVPNLAQLMPFDSHLVKP